MQRILFKKALKDEYGLNMMGRGGLARQRCLCEQRYGTRN